MWIKFFDPKDESIIALDAKEIVAITSKPLAGRDTTATLLTTRQGKTYEIAERDVSDLVLFHLTGHPAKTIDLTTLKRRGGFIKIS